MLSVLLLVSVGKAVGSGDGHVTCMSYQEKKNLRGRYLGGMLLYFSNSSFCYREKEGKRERQQEREKLWESINYP